MTTISALDPPPDETAALLDEVGALVAELVTGAAQRDIGGHDRGDDLVRHLLDARPADTPGEVTATLEQLRAVLATGVDNATAGELAYIPGSGLLSAGLGDLVAAVANRYTGLAGEKPARPV